MAASSAVEGGQLLGAVAQHGHAVGLQVLQGQAQVQDGLGAGTHHHDWGVGQLLQVGGDVHGGLRTPVDAADAASGEDFDARHVGDHHGGGDGGGAVGLAGAQHRQIPAAGFGDGLALLAQVLDLLLGAAGLQAAAQDGDGGGHRAVVPDDLLHLEGGLHVLGIGHAVGDDGGLQGHHGLAGSDGLGHLGGHVQILGEIHGCLPPVIKILLYTVQNQKAQDSRRVRARPGRMSKRQTASTKEQKAATSMAALV